MGPPGPVYNDNLTPSMAAPAPWASPGGPIILHLLPHLQTCPPAQAPSHGALYPSPGPAACAKQAEEAGGLAGRAWPRNDVQLPSQHGLTSSVCARDDASTLGLPSPRLSDGSSYSCSQGLSE